ncbi:MAG: hypothetical protein RLZZ163_68 [Actinomycetota bacterium]|jgi:hypothetical protein
MKQLGSFFGSVFGSGRLDPEAAHRKKVYREWDRQRARAGSASELAEIDAIFSRAL